MDNSRLRREQDILERLENVKRLIQMETTILIGLFVGGTIGFAAAAFCVAAKDNK